MRFFSSSAKLTPARTRFAPSPTGRLHLGSLRTALYNYLWARRTGGQFILRVEDTDQGRLAEGAEASLHDNLRWAGLEVDEGPEVGGPHEPYRQSERLGIYGKHIQVLLEKGAAYRCFCSAGRLETLRKESKRHGHSGSYDRRCVSAHGEEAERRAAAGEAHVVRLKSPDVTPVVEDIVHGTVNFQKAKPGGTTAFEDTILVKSDGFPTYHFANVVDDHLMEITHVIRGEEWLPSTPKHLAIYAAFDWHPPAFAHVPLLAAVGGAKLSKRHGDTTVEAYRESGFLPESMLNYLALMGWNAHIAQGETEVMSLPEMADRFDLSQITKGATIVTPEKLNFLQKQHYHRLADTPDGMARLVAQTQSELGKVYTDSFDDGYVEQVIMALKERIVDPLGVPQLGAYFFKEPEYTSAVARKFVTKLNGKSATSLEDLLILICDKLAQIDVEHWTGTEFNLRIERIFEEVGSGTANSMLMGVIRYAIAGGHSGAGVKQIMAIIGREKTLERFQNALLTCQA